MVENVRKTCEQLLRFDVRMRSIRYHLKAIEQDLTLVDRGWDLFYAVDYCDLYRFAFSLCSLMKKNGGGIPSSEERSRFANKSAARNFLFSGIGQGERLILLPPHAVELGHFLSSVRAAEFEREVQFRKLKEPDLLSEEHRHLLKEIHNFHCAYSGKKKPIPSEYLERGLEFLVTEFRDLLFLRLATDEQGLAELKDLFDPEIGRISHTCDIWPDFEEMFKDIDKTVVKSSKWFEMFQVVRTKWDSDLFDAQALLILERLNEALIPKKKAILLFSDAPSMASVLNWDLMGRESPKIQNKPRGIIANLPYKDRPFNDDYRVLRTPRTFLFYIMCMGDSRDQTILQINSRQKEIERYFLSSADIVEEFRVEITTDRCPFFDKSRGMLRDPDPLRCQNCGHSQRLSKLSDLLTDHDRIVKEFENVQLYLTQPQYLSRVDKLSPERLSKILDAELSNIICDFAEFVVNNSPELEKGILQRREKLDDEIRALRLQFPIRAITSAGAHGFGGIAYKAEKFLRLYRRLGFKSESVRQITKKLETAAPEDRFSFERSKDLLLELLELAYDEEKTGSESKLLRAALAYTSGEVDFCLGIVGDELLTDKTCAAFGLKYLQTLATCQKGISVEDKDMTRTAMDLARQFVEEYGNDPRSHFLIGLVTLRLKRTGFSAECDLGGILKFQENALELCKDPELELAILNNEVYAIYLFASGSSLTQFVDKGQQLVNRMASISDPDMWPPSYLDTAACMICKLAETEAGRDGLERLFKRAEDYEIIALDLASAAGAPIKKIQLYQRHLEKIRRAKSKLVGSQGQKNNSQ